MLKQQFSEINDGISLEDRTQLATKLANLLADSYSLYLKTQNFHWNVTGPMFNSLHLMFETQYLELAIAVDTIAERIRALGFVVPGSYKEFSSLSKVTQAIDILVAELMLKDLIGSHEVVVTTARDIITLAERANDQVSLDLITQRLAIHEKTLWMLRSNLA